MGTSFVVVVSIILIVQIVSICSFMRVLSVAKAGKVNKFFVRNKFVWGKNPKVLQCAGQRVDVSGLKELYVHGNSMKEYMIHDGQRVFVDEFFSDAQRNGISDYPVVAFNIFNMPFQSQYKLRKFVAYVDDTSNIDWNKVYDEFRDRIKISREEFVRDCMNKVERHKDLSGRLVLSETFDEDTGKSRYSLHPVNSLYGRVRYAV